MIGRGITLVLLACAFLFLSIPVQAKTGAAHFASTNVPLSDPSYQYLEKLRAHDLIDRMIWGQRPFSRRHIAKLVQAAQDRFRARLGEDPEAFTPASKAYLEQVFLVLSKRFDGEMSVVSGRSPVPKINAGLLDVVRLEQVLDASQPLSLRNSNGVGNIDAQVNPLFNYREGRHEREGWQFALETGHHLTLSRHVLLNFEPRLQMNVEDPDAEEAFFVNRAYGKFHLANWEIQAGRDNLAWGQGLYGGLVLSTHARGLDMVRIGNDDPFRFPWVFRHLGPTRLNFFFAGLGPEQFFPHSYMVGTKLSLHPTRWLEIGLSNVTVSGGEGSPDGSFADRVNDALPFFQIFTGQQEALDNKLGGFDVRIRLPNERRSELYFEFILEDTPGGVKVMFHDDAGYVGGVYLPRLLNEAGKVDLRMEFKRTGVHYYRHGQFLSGYTMNRRILGDPLGPDSQALYLNMNWQHDLRNLFSFDGAVENRSIDHHRGPRSETVIFLKDRDFPDERRYRGAFSWNRLWGSDLAWHSSARFGMEFLNDAGFSKDVQRFNLAGALEVGYTFH